jgi:hypothetical protein
VSSPAMRVTTPDYTRAEGRIGVNRGVGNAKTPLFLGGFHFCAVYKTAALPLSYASGSAPVRGTGPASGLFPMRDSTSSRFAHKTEKPAKPYPEFPLLAHAAGVWARKIRGKRHDFGKWHDPDGARAKYNAEKDDLQEGRGRLTLIVKAVY